MDSDWDPGLTAESPLVVAHPSRKLWSDVGVWTGVRNAVAHKGCWPLPPAANAASEAL